MGGSHRGLKEKIEWDIGRTRLRQAAEAVDLPLGSLTGMLFTLMIFPLKGNLEHWCMVDGIPRVASIQGRPKMAL